MSFLMDTHVHTMLSSACGHATASEIARAYKDAGFDAITITDHFHLGNTCVDKTLPWEVWVHDYCNAYRSVREKGQEIGLQVFFGWETTYDHGEDFLVYGLDEDWLLKHPEIVTWDQAEQYHHVKAEGGYVFQAHPFRERNYMNEVKIHPHHSDAWEIANSGNRSYMDILAKRMAEEFGLPGTAGSDTHHTYGEKARTFFGVEFDTPVTSISDYAKRIVSGSGYRLHVPEDRFSGQPENPWFEVYEFDENNVPILRTGLYYEGAPLAPNPKIKKTEAKK